MTIHAYLEECVLLFTVSSIVEHFSVVTRKETETDGYLRVRAILIEEELFEASIYCQLTSEAVRLVDYRFHWQDKEGKLKLRWDNATHHPQLRTYPHHVHDGGEMNVKEYNSVDLKDVLQIIESNMKNGALKPKS